MLAARRLVLRRPATLTPTLASVSTIARSLRRVSSAAAPAADAVPPPPSSPSAWPLSEPSKRSAKDLHGSQLPPPFSPPPSVQMSSGAATPPAPPSASDAGTGGGNGGGSDGAAAGNSEDLSPPREERRSPASMLGTKRIGLTVLPEMLTEGITEAVYETDNPKSVRFAFLELLEPPKEKQRGGSRNMPEHALARATALLPGQFAAVSNVLSEVVRRVGPDALSGPFLEVSGGIAPGFWAASEVLGKDAVKGYTLVHKTRFGLDLARRLTEALDAPGVDYKRDLAFVSSAARPSVAMSTFHLSTLPKAAGRAAHLRHLLETGAQHIVLVDKASPAGWAAISEARTYLLGQSKPEAPLHVLAPCPHDGICPVAAGGKESCAFSQRLQRPRFLIKTKHAKRGEEDITYTYLVVSRGERPKAVPLSADAAGRVGAVAKDEAVRRLSLSTGQVELREVEGGDFEMVAISDPAAGQYAAVLEQESDPKALEKTLRTEAYSWPRLIAPPIKRSGHVTMDLCTAEGNIQRQTVAKSHGKQEYYDARKTAWGDLWPHAPKGKSIVRTRGVRRLTKPDHTAGGEFKSTGDRQLDALLRSLGAEEVVAEFEDVEEGVEAAETTESGEAPVPATKDPKAGKRNSVTYKSTSPSGRVTVVHSSRGYATHARPRVPVTSPTPARRHMSVRRAEGAVPKVTVAKLHELHESGTPITMLTAYDYPTALLCARSGIDIILIGDSMAQVAMGHGSTVGLTLDEMIYHVKMTVRAVAAASGVDGIPGTGGPFIIADMPFGYAEASVPDGVRAAVRLLKEGGADAIKIEGGREIVPLVERLTTSGVPVMPHIGLQPQRAAATGYKVQAKTATAAADLLDTALALQKAGAFGLLLEAIPHRVATVLAKRVGIPTIGIGAGPNTSGQVLVITDMLGMYDMRPSPPEPAQPPQAPVADGEGHLTPRPGRRQGDEVGVIPTAGEPAPPRVPKFVRQFANVGREARRGVDAYIAAVRDRSFPAAPKETYVMPRDELGEFLRLVEETPAEAAPKDQGMPSAIDKGEE